MVFGIAALRVKREGQDGEMMRTIKAKSVRPQKAKPAEAGFALQDHLLLSCQS